MGKIIEELAKQYVEYQTDEQGYGSMEACKQDVAIYYDDAKEVLSWLFAKPLRNRLTAEEKERVREEYADNKYLIESASLSYVQREVFQKINETLEYIFGADFFKEEE